MSMVGGGVDTGVGSDRVRLPRWLAILLVSLAGLLLEVGYTRIVSYKLWYYYTYLVIGLALLGIGSGGVFVVVCRRLRQLGDRTHHRGVLDRGRDQHRDRLPRRRADPRRHGRDLGLRHGARRSRTCSLLGAHLLRAVRDVHRVRHHRRRCSSGGPATASARLYFADLVGAGLGCLLAIPLITRLGPPRVIMLAALDLRGRRAASRPRRSRSSARSRWSARVVLVVAVVRPATCCPTSAPRTRKQHAPVTLRTRQWGPVFRVDVVKPSSDDALELPAPARRHLRLRHPALRRQPDVGRRVLRQGSPLAAVRRARRRRPRHELIIGSAGGNEILASLCVQGAATSRRSSSTRSRVDC